MSERVVEKQRLGICDLKQYEHAGLHEQFFEHGQKLPPFPCENWKPVPYVAKESAQ